jgi:NitT/TauT family transport system permease protein
VIRVRLARFLTVAILIALLQVLCTSGVISPTTLPAPTDMFASLWLVLARAETWASVALTFRDILLSAALAIIGGFVAGVILHRAAFLRRGIEPFLASYYAVPTFIFYPVLVVVLGAGRAPIIAIAVALAIVTMISATLTGLDRIPVVLQKTARALRLSVWDTAVHLQLPAILPYVFTGIKLAISYAFIGVIASEFILSGDGIGYSIAYAYNNFDNTTMYGLILLIIIVAAALNAGLDVMDRYLQTRSFDVPRISA